MLVFQTKTKLYFAKGGIVSADRIQNYVSKWEFEFQNEGVE